MGWRETLSAGLVAVAKTLRTESISAAAKTRQPESQVQTYAHQISDPGKREGPREREYSAQKPIIRQEWEVGDDDVAWSLAEQGQLQLVVQLIEKMFGDGVISGLLDTRSSGLLKLPVTITGDEELVDELSGGEKNVQKARSGLLWKMFPFAALARIIQFGIMLGAGIGYFVQTEDDPCPILHVIEHQFLIHRRDADGRYRLFYRTASDGEIEIVPGDGRWFVFAPYGFQRFWVYGKWRPVGRQWLLKNASQEQRETWGNRLARGVIWITAPPSSNEDERDTINSFFSSVIAPPVVTLLEGWALKVHDVQGRGFEVWKDGKEDADNEIRMALSGQLVTSGGQTLGFGSGYIFSDIAQTLIDSNAEALAESVHDHGLEPWADRRGLCGPWAEWDTTPPGDKETIANAVSAYGKALSDVAKGHADIKTDAVFDVHAFAAKMRVDLKEDAANDDAEIRTVSGIKVRIEVPEGAIRKGVGANGVPWQTLMSGASYGEIPGTEGADGEALDAYVGPFGDAHEAYILEQLDFYGALDEYKIFLGFFSLEHAQETYRRLANADYEGRWVAVPAELIAGLAKGAHASVVATEPTAEEAASGVPMSEEDQANAPSAGGQIFAYHITTDAVKMKEVRASVGQPIDPRMGEMYPSEWSAYLKAESEKDLGTSTQGADATNVNKPTSQLPDKPTEDAQDKPDVVAESEDAEGVDPPTDEDAIALAQDMTELGIDRCEHNRVNECPKCGVERVRGVLRDEAGNVLRDELGNVRWKIAWRALKPKSEPAQIAAEAPKKYSHIDFTPPKGAREEAQKGLDWRKEFGRGGTEVGVARARDISNGVSLSPETVRRMKAFFDRHENGAGKGSKPGEDGYPSAWVIAWKLWGGDAGYAWARKVVRQMEAADEDS